MFFLKRMLKRLQEYNEILEIDTIARRYLTMNSFDGVLTMLGILVGSFFAGIHDARIVIIAGFGASIAMGVSGFWGSYMTEKAERRKELRELEKSMLTRLKKTKIGRASKAAPYILALIDGLAPFFAALIVLIPFFITPAEIAYYASMGLAFGLLFLLGMFLGSISKESIILSGLRMSVAGIICVALTLLVGVR
jgi:predicted membrane protein (TIGR00267 family)